MKTRRHPPRLGALLLATVGSAGAALAQNPLASLADCHGIASGTERLACYDAVSGRQDGGHKEPASSAPAATATIPAPKGTSSASIMGESSTAVAHDTATPMLDSAWDFDPGSSPFDIRFYRANYLLIGRYSTDVNNAPYAPLFEAAGQPPQDLRHTEAKFQLSFKARLWTTDDRRWGVWAAYTQQNQWQVYNGDVSRPFRETNYMPELFASYKPDVELPGGFRWALLNAGYNHQSNGRSDVLSRSWDRLFAEFGVERENLVLSARLWYRIPENANNDDNPDITDYYGNGEIGALYRWRGNSFSALARGSFKTGKGAVELNWTTPPLLGPLRGYVQLFSGYGESLIDYNWKQTTIGAGVALSDGL
jgi:phospholipase A1